MAFRAGIISILIFSCVLGCKKKSGDSSGDGSPQNPENPPVNPEEALARLTESQKTSLSQWQEKSFKACDPAEAFGLKNEDESLVPGVDIKQFLKQNLGSPVVVGTDQVIVFSGYRTLSGVGTTKVERSWETNGRRILFQAETKRDGSTCELFLFGQKVHETFIAETMTIGAHWLSARTASTMTGLPEITPIGTSDKSEANRHGVFAVVNKALTPTKEAQAFLGEKYGLRKENSARLFTLSNKIQIDSVLRIKGEPSAIWSSEVSGGLIAASSMLKESFAGTPSVLPLEVRLKIPAPDMQKSLTDLNLGALSFTVPVSIAKKDTSSFEYLTQRAEFKGSVAFDRDEALDCLRDRALAYRGSSTSQFELRPSVGFMMDPCQSLYSDVKQLSYESGLMKMLLPEMFSGVAPSRSVQYGGWDGVLIDLAIQAFAAGKDPRTELDPTGKTVVIGKSSDYLISINRELAETRNLENSKSDLLKMGIRWALGGFDMSDEKIGMILSAVDNTMATFEVSTKTLLSQIEVDPNSRDRQDDLVFVRGISSAYKAEAMKARGLASELQYESFQADVFNKAIQKRVKEDEWIDWSTKLTAIKGEISPFQNLGSSRGTLVGLSVKWLNSREIEPQGLAGIYSAIDNVLVPFEVSTKKLLQELASSLSSGQASLAFARGITPEYKDMSLSILGIAQSVGFDDWGTSFFDSILQKMPPLEQLKAWKSLWMEAQGFKQREATRTKDDSGSFNESNVRDIIRKALDENWTPTNFSDLEAIAIIARAKNTCERHKGISSLANCAGMSAFSNKARKLFDPNFAGRYVALAREFEGYFSRMTAHDWTTLKWSLVGEFFGSFEPIWSRCDGATFRSRAELLSAQVTSILQETDQIRRWEIERKIKENIENCR